jgi:hypothetical protein
MYLNYMLLVDPRSDLADQMIHERLMSQIFAGWIRPCFCVFEKEIL